MKNAFMIYNLHRITREIFPRFLAVLSRVIWQAFQQMKKLLLKHVYCNLNSAMYLGIIKTNSGSCALKSDLKSTVNHE